MYRRAVSCAVAAIVLGASGRPFPAPVGTARLKRPTRTDDPGWVDQLFGWVGSHPRTRMMVYNQGVNPDGPFRLSRYPRAGRELRRLLAGSKFPAYAQEWR